MSLNGQRVGRYHILRLLRRGGMGDVYLAEDSYIKQQVAIKVIRTEMELYSSSPDAAKEVAHLFYREVKAIGKLDHPHILPLFDYGETQINNTTLVYLVMPYRQEGSLADWLHRRGKAELLSSQEVVHIIYQAARALQHAHDRQIIHRDVKPSNFLIRAREESPESPDVLLADFGTAKFTTVTARTSQSVCGTPTYMAPEQWSGNPVPATDQYALAVMAYELLTGRPPFQGGAQHVMFQHLTVQPLSPSILNPHLSQDVDRVILRALAKQPELRFPSVIAFAQALQQSINSMQQGKDIPIFVTRPNTLATDGTLRATLAISPWEALEGASRTVILPEGRSILVFIPPGVQSGSLLYLDEQGSPCPDGRAARLVLTIVVSPQKEALSIPDFAALERSAAASIPPQPAPPTFAFSDASPALLINTIDSPSVPNPTTGAQPISIAGVANRTMENQRQMPVSPLPLPIGDNPLSVGQPRASLSSLNRLSRRTRALLGVGILLILLLLLGVLALPPLHNGKVNPPATQTMLPQLPSGIGAVMANGEYIGVSDGSVAFDTNRLDGDLKTQAAEKLRAKDFGSAESLWEAAIREDTNDAEALIYREDQGILDAGDPYITIVVGTTLTGNAGDGAVGHDATQAAYVAQREYNTASKLPGGMKVRLLIANSGHQSANTTTVAQQIVRLARKDPTIVGVMGWATTATTLNAIKVLSPVKIPMVGNSGADLLTDWSHYFFRVASPASVQAGVGARYVEQTLHAKTAALFVDLANNFTLGLANGFTDRFVGDGNTIVVKENYTVGDSASVLKGLQDALSKHPEVIYFAGYATDAGLLLTHLQPSDPLIIGGSSLYTLAYPVAARKSLSHLRFTAFSYPDEWDWLHLTAEKPPFFADYKAALDPYNQHTSAPYGYSRPEGTTMEWYDAISALLYGCSIALAEKNPFTGIDLQLALTRITGTKALQGITGQISFDSHNTPVDRAITLICNDRNNDFQLDGLYGKFLVGEPTRIQFSSPSACG